MGWQPFNLKPSSLPCHQVAWYTRYATTPSCGQVGSTPAFAWWWRTTTEPSSKEAGPGDRTGTSRVSVLDVTTRPPLLGFTTKYEVRFQVWFILRLVNLRFVRLDNVLVAGYSLLGIEVNGRRNHKKSLLYFPVPSLIFLDAAIPLDEAL